MKLTVSASPETMTPHSDPDRDPAAEGALRIGFWLNGTLAAIKVVGGLIAGSPSLLADGYHSIGDVLTGGLGWLSYRWSKLPPDEDHHYGHGKYEALAAAAVGGVLVATGVAVAWGAWGSEPANYESSQALIAVLAALISIVGNEVLVRVQGRAAKLTGSPTLAAMTKDSRSDSLTSLLVIVGVLGAAAGVSRLEPLATMIIGLAVLAMGVESLRSAIHVLTDRVHDTGLRSRIEALAEAIPGVSGVQSVSVHPLGTLVRVDMEISVRGDLSVRRGHEIAHEVGKTVTRHEDDVVDVSVHVNPA